MKSLPCLLAALCTLVPLGLHAQENLLDPVPGTKFWYPPYASAQPEVTDGIIEIDLGQAAGAPMAIFEIDLPAEIQPGGQYLFEFDAAAEPNAPIIVVLPEADPTGKTGDDGKAAGRSDWAMHNIGGKKRSIEFVYDPEVNPQKLQFFWLGNIVDQKPTFKVSNLSLTKLD